MPDNRGTATRYALISLLSLLLANGCLAAGTPPADCRMPLQRAAYAQAYEHCRARAEKGDAEAAFIIARLYARGLSRTPDLARSVHWLQRAAQEGHAEAAYNLGIAYHYGKGVPADISMAVAAYRQAAAADNPKALRNLAALYESGVGVPRDPSRAFRLYAESAALGQGDSQLKAAVMLLRGIGTPADPAAARAWMEKAAASGNADAQVSLAMLLADSDVAISLHWYAAAAQQDNPVALHNLALLSFSGRGVARDLDRALAYAARSAALGNENSRGLQRRILAERQAGGRRDAPPETGGRSGGYRDGAWLTAQPADRYVVQLAQFSSQAALARFLDDYQLRGKVHYLYGVTPAGKVYVVLYANDYAQHDGAHRAARQDLPPAVAAGAWIRSYGALLQTYSEEALPAP